MRLLLIIGFFFSFSVAAETCRQLAIKKASKNVAAAEYEKQKKESPALAFEEEAVTRACEVNSIKPILLGKQFHSLCLGVQTPYRQRCLREWIEKRRMITAAEAGLIISLIPLAAAEDKNLPHVYHQIVLTQLVDNVLAVFEKIDFTQFYVQRLGTDHPDLKKEIYSLQKKEAETLSQLQIKTIPLIEEKIMTLRDRSAREPASHQHTKHWVNTMIPKMDRRLQGVKNQRYEVKSW